MRHYERKQKIVDYIKKNVRKGYPLDSLKWALINQGYLRIEVEAAVEDAKKQMAEEAPILKERPVIKHEIIDDENQTIPVKKSWWRRLLGL